MNITNCDFFMLTVGEENRPGATGTKKRHYDFNQAEREATRLCKEYDKEVFIVGVIASVKPKHTVIDTSTKHRV